MAAENESTANGSGSALASANGKTIDIAKLREASAAVGGKHSEVKRGPGRPLGSGKNQRAAQATAKTTAETTSAPTPIDLEFIRKVATQGVSLLDSFVCKKVHRSTCLISPGLEKYADNVTAAVEMSTGEKEMVAEIVVSLAQKYNAAFRFAPEISLVVWGIGYGVRVNSALKEIEEIAARVEANRNKRSPDANSPQAN